MANKVLAQVIDFSELQEQVLIFRMAEVGKNN
jgi:hypothetical protein